MEYKVIVKKTLSQRDDFSIVTFDGVLYCYQLSIVDYQLPTRLFNVNYPHEPKSSVAHLSDIDNKRYVLTIVPTVLTKLSATNYENQQLSTMNKL